VTRQRKDSKRKTKRQSLILLAAGFATFGVGLYALGFGAFVATLPRPQASDDAQADGIVALTGDGGRLAPAVALLEMGNGGRLLITGVNKLISKTELKSLLKGGPSFDCCADLGFAAADTRGNAQEAASWTHKHHYRSLIVVTAAYHMPRSLLEFGAEMPDVKLVPFPVAADAPAALSWQNVKRLQGEYAKYLAARFRVTVLTPQHRA
jgi:uncharacterized SAM-binding protein YcdF (DUF218 family)